MFDSDFAQNCRDVSFNSICKKDTDQFQPYPALPEIIMEVDGRAAWMTMFPLRTGGELHFHDCFSGSLPI